MCEMITILVYCVAFFKKYFYTQDSDHTAMVRRSMTERSADEVDAALITYRKTKNNQGNIECDTEI